MDDGHPPSCEARERGHGGISSRFCSCGEGEEVERGCAHQRTYGTPVQTD